MLYFEHECFLGHRLYEDDPRWCTTCCAEVVPLQIPNPEDEDAAYEAMLFNLREDVMQDAEQFSPRYRELLYGKNDDSPFALS